MWTEKRGPKRRSGSELQECQHVLGEEEPAEAVGVPREGAQEPWVVRRPGRTFKEESLACCEVHGARARHMRTGKWPLGLETSTRHGGDQPE